MHLRFVLLFMTLLSLSTAKEWRSGTWFDIDIATSVAHDTVVSVPQDLYNIAVTPFTHPLESLSFLGLTAGLVAVDYPLTLAYQEWVEKPLDLYSLPTLFIDTPITHGADSWVVFGMVGHYLAGFALGDERSQVAAVLAGKAVAYSFVTSHVLLKALTGRNRPADSLATCTGSTSYDTCSPFDWGNWHAPYWESNQYGTAMPSFHLTMYFAVARVYADVYENYWLPYLGATLIHISDIKGHQHWLSDMVAGALIGTFIGHQVTSSYFGTTEGGSTVTILPRAGGLALSYDY